jgi:DNA-directed RNA polymerase subunit beta'
VYRATGVYLHDKHSEVIIRQMLQRVYIEDAGDTLFVPGSLMDRFVFAEKNVSVLTQGGNPATARPALLGTIKVALYTESWIAAASFQETTRVLTDAAIAGQTDVIQSMKQCIVLGRKIPVGGEEDEEQSSLPPQLDNDQAS